MLKRTLEGILVGALTFCSANIMAQDAKRQDVHVCEDGVDNLVCTLGELVDEQIRDNTKQSLRYDVSYHYYFWKYRGVLADLSRSCIPSHDKNDVPKRVILDLADKLVVHGHFVFAEKTYSAVNESAQVNFVMHNLERNLLSSMNNFEATLSFLRNKNIFPKTAVVRAVKKVLNRGDYVSVCAMIDYSRHSNYMNLSDCADEILPVVNLHIGEDFSFVESVYARFGRDIPVGLIQDNAGEILFKHPFALNYFKSKNIVIPDETLVCVVDKLVCDQKFSDAVKIFGEVKNASKNELISFADALTAQSNSRYLDYGEVKSGVLYYNRAGYVYTTSELSDILFLLAENLSSSERVPSKFVDLYIALGLPTDSRCDALINAVYAFDTDVPDIKEILKRGFSPSRDCLVQLGSDILSSRYEFDFSSVEKIVELTGQEYDDEHYFYFANSLIDMSNDYESVPFVSKAGLFHNGVGALKHVKKRISEKYFDEVIDGRIFDVELNVFDVLSAYHLCGRDLMNNSYVQEKVLSRIKQQQVVISECESISSVVNRFSVVEFQQPIVAGLLSDVVRSWHLVEQFSDYDTKCDLRNYVAKQMQLTVFDDVVFELKKDVNAMVILESLGDLLFEAGSLDDALICYETCRNAEKVRYIKKR